MQIGIFTRGKDSHSHKYEEAFAKGLTTHNITPTWYSSGDKPLDIDLAVVWGVNNQGLIQHLEKYDIDYLVLERGYIGDRKKFTSCGFNGLNGWADFQLEYVDDKRLHHVEQFLKPIRKEEGDYILVMGQVSGDASVRYIGWNGWLQKTFDRLKKSTDKPIYYRVHPLDHSPFIPTGMDVLGGKLDAAIQGAAHVVTLNSNSGVDALLAGVPVISDDEGSMIWSANPLNRKEWLEEMSYCQWTIEEMASGETWQHLGRKFDGIYKTNGNG